MKVGDAVALVRVAAAAAVDDEAERVVLARVRAAPLQLHAARRTGESCEGEVKGRISKVVFKVSHQVEKDVSSTLLQKVPLDFHGSTTTRETLRKLMPKPLLEFD